MFSVTIVPSGHRAGDINQIILKDNASLMMHSSSFIKDYLWKRDLYHNVVPSAVKGTIENNKSDRLIEVKKAQKPVKIHHIYP